MTCYGRIRADTAQRGMNHRRTPINPIQMIQEHKIPHFIIRDTKILCPSQQKDSTLKTPHHFNMPQILERLSDPNLRSSLHLPCTPHEQYLPQQPPPKPTQTPSRRFQHSLNILTQNATLPHLKLGHRQTRPTTRCPPLTTAKPQTLESPNGPGQIPHPGRSPGSPRFNRHKHLQDRQKQPLRVRMGPRQAAVHTETQRNQRRQRRKVRNCSHQL